MRKPRVSNDEQDILGAWIVLGLFLGGVIWLLVWNSSELNRNCRQVYGKDYYYSERNGKWSRGCYNEPNQSGERKIYREAQL